MPPLIDLIGPFTLRAAAILTNAYVGALVSSILPLPTRVQDHNQLILYVDFTIGSLTNADIKIEFAGPKGGSDLYQETDETASVASSVDTKGVNTVIHRMSLTGKYRFALPIVDGDVKVSIIGNGTVTSSSAKVTLMLAKNYS